MIQNKDQVFKTFVQWKARVENQCDRRILPPSVSYHKNISFALFVFLVKRMNITLSEKVRCMLSNKNFRSRPRSLWREVVHTACYLINRYTCKTPHEIWDKRPAEYKDLRTFGCTVYYHSIVGKLDPRAKKGSFIG